MAGPGIWGTVVISCLCALGCGDTESTKTAGSPSGGASSGGAGSGGARPVDANIATMRMTRANVHAYCDKVRSCYPTLEMSDTLCYAPGDAGVNVMFPDPSIAYELNVETCMAAYPDQSEVSAVVQCALAASEATLACFADCPATGSACQQANNTALEMCPKLSRQADVQACFDAQTH